MLQASPLKREFSYMGLKLADPNPKLTVEEIRSFYSGQYPDLATAAIMGPEAVGDKLLFSFVRAIEIRGAFAFFSRFRVKAFACDCSPFRGPFEKWSSLIFS